MRAKMPAPLDLSKSKLSISDPRMNLRRSASHTNSNWEKVPLSATSARFSFNHLLFSSPPPSPSLPALITPPRKSPIHPRPSRVFRLTFWTAFAVLLLYFATFPFRTGFGVPTLNLSYLSNHDDFEMVGQDDLPDFPTPIVITDRNGNSKWTVSIPPSYDFPLSVKEYGEMCKKCREVAARVRDMRHRTQIPGQNLLSAEAPNDPYFVDVAEAQQSGLLPEVTDKWPSKGQGRDGALVGENKDSLVEKPLCHSSMTFILETADAGIGHTIMQLWTFYGLAQRQRRAFFIDDSRWAYGKYTDLFQAPPVPNCRPPPRHEMIPCPPSARHLVVTSETTKEMWASSLAKPHSDFRAQDEDGLKELFDLAHEGYRALYYLNKDDSQYVTKRVKEIRTKALSGDGNSNGLVVGVHVRHGDCHPLEYQYRGTYIPMEIIANRAQEVITTNYNGTGKDGSDDEHAKRKSFIVLASDDPTVYDSEDFKGSMRAQEQIRLASKQEVHKAAPDRHVMHHFEDESFGWEGGFFAAMFWNLGLSSMSASNAATAKNKQLAPSAETLRLRGYIGRAYMMDLAVLAGASDAVICTVSSMGCRLLAVMMGWEKAMEAQNWINVDGPYGWTGISL
ncbi:uncharacterized protein CTRU02_205444 [Colletotrichum truncatum]|uniref:Uncharacterized protein n=1 Tax=Colletotrichum truncatum TaxID=5467 RepID=A0ACC3Z413_COLTU|nr:uncharacterized protein CTRU02_04500 [Colletotrichum truncatum]KAF6795690.1 hypothetical protein CTRU02_04500 [Colletotrichum truncatum]